MRDEWATGLIGSWDHWLDLPQRVGDRLAPLIGARPGEVVVHDSTTVNLYQLVDAACALRPDRGVIAIGAADFPTDRYVVDGIAAARGLRRARRLRPPRRCRRRGALGRRLPHRRSRRRRRRDGSRRRAAGAIALWDLSHAAGVLGDRPRRRRRAARRRLHVQVPQRRARARRRSATWPATCRRRCRSRSGVGSPKPISSTMGSTFVPQPDIRRVLLGTPSILALAAADEGIALTRRGRDRGDRGQGTGTHRLRPGAVRPARPGPRRLATQLAAVATSPCTIPNAEHLVAELAEQRCDHRLREPDIIRIGCSPLTTRFIDVFDGLTRLRHLVGDSR